MLQIDDVLREEILLQLDGEICSILRRIADGSFVKSETAEARSRSCQPSRVPAVACSRRSCASDHADSSTSSLEAGQSCYVHPVPRQKHARFRTSAAALRQARCDCRAARFLTGRVHGGSLRKLLLACCHHQRRRSGRANPAFAQTWCPHAICRVRGAQEAGSVTAVPPKEVHRTSKHLCIAGRLCGR